jgi:DNA-binding LacI/PurR family transcriptional regulator
MAARVFLQGGHRRIGCFVKQGDSLAGAYLRGMQSVLDENGCSMQNNDILFTSSTDNYQNTKQILQKRFSEPNPPTAIFCDHDTLAQRLYWAAGEMNLAVPGDLAIIGFGDAVREGTFRRQLASVTISGVELGQKAASLLDEMRSGKRPINSTEVVLVDPAFFPGTTV